MINVEFYLKNDELTGFSVKGHAGYADYGSDIVCASVTSTVEMTANGITEILGEKADVLVYENEVKLMLNAESSEYAIKFLQALRLHLELLSKDYPQNIKLHEMEV